MNLREYRQLQAEAGAIDAMLSEIPEEQVLDRMGLESRLREIQVLLGEQALLAEQPTREPVRARLTFRGRPIVGSHGVFAEFGASAVSAFAKAVASVGASMRRPLGSRGQLPMKEDFGLLITGTATGSFGFDLEEAAQANLELFPTQSPLEVAVEQTQGILRATTGNDDELAEALAEVDPRAVEAVRSFLGELVGNEAVCTLEFHGEVFRFSDVAQVQRCSARLEQDNIRESDDEKRGRFLGVLPNRRSFEFMVEDGEEVIVGKISGDLEDPARINEVLNQPVVAQLHARKVGSSKPRYLLLGYRAEAN